MTFWQGGDLRRFDEVHAEAFVDRSAAGRPADRKGFCGSIEELYTRFPDFAATVGFIAIDETQSLATICWSAQGGATAFTGIEIIRCQSGQVVERWGEWDGGVS